MTSADTELLTGKEVAARLRISINTLYRLTDKGQVPGHIRIGNLRRYRADAIHQLMQAQHNGSNK